MRYSHRLIRVRSPKVNWAVAATLITILVGVVVLFGVSNLNIADFGASFLTSLVRVSVSYVVALGIALTLGFVVVGAGWGEKILLPVLDVLQSFPSFALLPILLVYFGRGLISLSIVLILEMIWPILFAIITNYKGLRSDIFEAAQIFGATGSKRWVHVVIPAILPAIVTGSIVAWGEAWEAVIGAEIIVNNGGLGNFFSQLDPTSQRGLTLVAITGFLLMLFVINKLIWLPMLESVTRYQSE